MSWVFRAALALVAWAYAVFPVLLLVRGALRPRPHRVAEIEPSVSVIIAAYDEVASIGERIRNLLAADYPADRLEIVIASDGSTDGTNDAVRAFGSRVRLLELPRCGKGPALMAAVEASHGEILVFSDANSHYLPDAIRCLVRHFADADVGGVAGNQVYLPAGSVAAEGAGERQYWDLDRLLKVAQSRSDSVVGATGAIYAIRRGLFRPIPFGVADDLSVTFGVLAAGARFVFAPDAVALEPVAPSHGAEFTRKVRVVTRGLQCVVAWRELLDPRRHGFLALVVLSRKVLMRTMAVPLVALFVSSLVLARSSRRHATLATAQVAAYGLGLIGIAAPGGRLGRHRLSRVAAYFVMVQAASLVGLWNVLRGRRGEGWQTARSLPGPAFEPGARATTVATEPPGDATGDTAA